jgi:hypothetical protein
VAGFSGEIEAFFAAIDGGAPSSPSFADEVATYQVMDEIQSQILADPTFEA